MVLLLAALLACTPKGDRDTQPEGDADADTDADTDSDADTDTTPEDTGPYLDPEDPSFIAGFGDSSFEAEEGRWLVVGAETWLTGTADSNLTTFNAVVEGDLALRGSFPLRSVNYDAAVTEDKWDFRYTGAGGASFVVDGHDEAGEALWGHLEGAVALTDAMGGPALSMDSLVLTCWPQR